MDVTRERSSGTIGGGRLEFDVISHARKMLESGLETDQTVISLGPAIGQCCGGRVKLTFQTGAKETPKQDLLPVYVFGGGHVGRALVTALGPLPFDIHLVETREDYLRELPQNVTAHHTALPETVVNEAPKGSAFVILTHDHGLDFLIAEEALRRADAVYVGLIGSKTKRAVLAKKLAEANVSAEHLICPIGAMGLGDKRPEVIAAFVVAEILNARSQ